MDTFYSIAFVVGTLGFLFATINVIYPIKRLGIPTRKRAALVLGVSISLVVGGGTLIDPEKRSEQAEREVLGEQNLVRTEQRADGTEHLPDASVRGDIRNIDGDSDQSRARKAASEVTAPDPDPTRSRETGVVADRFVLQWEMEGIDLLLAIDTDLPDTAEVIVSVDRNYYQVGSDDAYSRDYLSKKGRISSWRKHRRVPIDDEAWKADLMRHQAEMAALSTDLAFEIDRIEDQVGVSAVVHVNQPDPRFGGRGNPNLSGDAVSRMAGNNDWYIIKAKKKIPLPLSGLPLTKGSKNVAYNGLEEGETYRLLEETPLMAARSVSGSNLKQTTEVLGKTRYIPAGRVVRVVSVDRNTGPHPWYKVEVSGKEQAMGWINSTALMRSGVVRE